MSRSREEKHLGESTVGLPRPSIVAPLGAKFTVLGKAKPTTFRLTMGSCVVGSGADANLVIAEPTVSRAHAELTLVPDGVAVADLGSRNGTYYLGQRVERMVLALGSRLRLGNVEVAIDAELDQLAGAHEDLASYGGLVGASPAMRRLFVILRRLEGSLVNVLVQGESGVGKELVARALHEHSLRAASALVVVNCGALARELVPSTLFGHRRGAFTGAVEHRVGAFESADGGTLFLDEIGELPLDVQPVLLRALEAGEIVPVGESQPTRVSVRLIAATNRDLSEDVKAGRFRADLFYRLAVVNLVVPPLRDRLEDVPALAQSIARRLGVFELPADFVERLVGASWPGNVRELRNAIEAYVALGTDEHREPQAAELDPSLFRSLDFNRPYAELKDELVERFTRAYLLQLLERTRGNQSEAARLSGLDRTYLGKLLSKLGVSR